MNSTTQTPKTTHPAFNWIRSQTIDSLNITIEEYRHKKTDAVHYHLAAENEENVFFVALRTVPMDSTGVAHILEHTALCGSEKYPVRDPFFMMIRRSLNTFMNAFTSSDWTAYPFASQNRKDFNNLLDVYLDAVFFSRLDPLDFAQEGHRVEFSNPEDASTDLVFKGVVFNEMKGAMSSVISTLWQTLCTHLYPTTTYHYNSGGDPENIPDLSYEQLKSFYKSHYHPSNAIFMTYGDITAAEHQQCFEDRALSCFDKLDKRIEVPREQRLTQPIRIAEPYAFNEDGSCENKTHVVMGWLLGESTDLSELLQAQLLTSVLLDNSASPLQKALETTELGSSPSPLCGLEDSMRELTFVCGLEGTNNENIDAIEALILDTIKGVAENGVPQEQIEAVLHQLELHQREVGGDSYPYGMQLIFRAISNATHRGDPLAALNLDPVLEQLYKDIQDPEYIKRLAKTLLLDNQHRVTLVMSPNTELSGRRDAAEANRLASIKAAMSDDEKQAVIKQAKALVDRQNQQDDESILPKVGLADVPAEIKAVASTVSNTHDIDLTAYTQGTNGLTYQQIIIELPKLPNELLELLPYYTNCLTELGVGKQSYLETQELQAKVCGSINAYTTIRSTIDDEQDISAYLVLSSKALAKNQHEQIELMYKTLHEVRFDEHSRLQELLSQQRAHREQSVTSNGHGLAMLAASSGMSPTSELSHRLSGLVGIQAIKQLDDTLKDEEALQRYAEQLATLHQTVLDSRKQLLLITEKDRLEDCQKILQQQWLNNPSISEEVFSLEKVREPRKQLWIANTQVNFCAKAYPTVPVNHPDAAVLTVLGGFMRNGYLHRSIREQGGAYGGGANQDSSSASFRFFSYRDPRLEETLNDFDAAIEWLLTTEHDVEQLEQAILGVISSIDKPASPAGEAKHNFHSELFGRTLEQRRCFREKILNVTLTDLKEVAKQYLKPELASIAVITNQATADKTTALIEREQLTVISL